MFYRKEVKKRGMELIKGNLLFFFIMILLTMAIFTIAGILILIDINVMGTNGIYLLSLCGILVIFIQYFVTRNSLKICSGIELNSSNWFDFDLKSFIPFIIRAFLITLLIIVIPMIIFFTEIIIFSIWMELGGMSQVMGWIGIFLIYLTFPFFLLVTYLLMFHFYFSRYIAVEYPAVGPLNSLKLSYILTKSHLIDVIKFSLSFILWWFLIIITFGIAVFFVDVYTQLSKTCLYNEFKAKSTVFKEEISKYGY